MEGGAYTVTLDVEFTSPKVKVDNVEYTMPSSLKGIKVSFKNIYSN